MTHPVKITVMLTRDAFAALESSFFAEAVNVTDIINRALLFYATVGATPVGQYVMMLEAGTGKPWRKVGILE